MVLGKMHGAWKLTAPDGKVTAKGAYEQGERSGAWVEWTDTGRVEGTYVRDHREGLWMVYDTSGKPTGQALFEHGAQLPGDAVGALPRATAGTTPNEPPTQP
jgi:antitoxin component YwqK of YwqJK toxin-antitoxin module